MRLLLTGDSQVGSGLDLGTGEHGPGSRLQDQLDVLGKISEIAHEEKVDAVCHLGDIFERPTPPPWQVIGVQSWVRDLKLPVVFVLGNHDLKSPALPHVLGIFDQEVRVFDRPGVFQIAGSPIAVLPWAPMNRMAAGESMPRAELKSKTVDALIFAAQALRVEAGEGAILLGHWAVSGSTLPSGHAIEEFMDEPILPWTDLDALGFRLAAFGHIHNPQVIAAGVATTPMIYVGSPAACNFGEAGTPHGVWIWDDKGVGDLRFRDVPDRPFVTVDYEPGGELPEIDPGAFVRVRYQTTEGKPVDEASLRAALDAAGAKKVFIRGKVERVSRARVEIDDESIDPSAALELWLAHNDVNGSGDAIRAEHARLLEAL